MLIRTFRAKNYKSLRETPVLQFGAGINVIVGQNNSGKTALLESLSGRAIASNPHRSLAALPHATDLPDDTTIFDFDIEFEQQEFLALCNDQLQDPWLTYVGDVNPAECEKRVREVIRRITVRFGAASVVGPSGGIWLTRAAYDNNLAIANPLQVITGHFRKQKDPIFSNMNIAAPNSPQMLEIKLFNHVKSRFYMFRAERLNIHRCPMGVATELAPDASNLPQVLDNLQSNPARYRRYVEYARRIFPHIHDIRLVSIGISEKEIRAWMASPETERTDLSFPLNNCGTGVGQVLAMLYVVLDSSTSKILLIDEPNSFLHPGAVRELVRILRENPRHQYIISTHFPAVVEVAQPTNLHVLSWVDGETKIVSADVRAVEAQRLVLKEVGASFADVFGAERILWVEGKTEEVCFPILLAHFGLLAARTVIIGVINTGDFERRDIDRVVAIYQRLSSGALMPEHVSFLFDREERSTQFRVDLQKLCKGRLHFTEARMFENYILCAPAICAVLQHALVDAELDNSHVGLPAIEAKLRELVVGEPNDVDAARILRQLFAHFSENRLPYEKVKHGTALLKAILNSNPVQLQSLVDRIATALNLETSPSSLHVDV
jgi:predicted ATPase